MDYILYIYTMHKYIYIYIHISPHHTHPRSTTYSTHLWPTSCSSAKSPSASGILGRPILRLGRYGGFLKWGYLQSIYRWDFQKWEYLHPNGDIHGWCKMGRSWGFPKSSIYRWDFHGFPRINMINHPFGGVSSRETAIWRQHGYHPLVDFFNGS